MARFPTAPALTPKRRQMLDMISKYVSDHGYPPSVREIGEAVGLTSPSTVHTHLRVLEREGFLRRDPAKPRAMEVRYDPASGAALASGPARAVPLVGDVAAGAGVLAEENVEELVMLPEELAGRGTVFMLRVRGDSMVGAGILDGDQIVVRQQPEAERGDYVVAGIPGEEATVKTYKRRGRKIVLEPANPAYEAKEYETGDVTIYGKVIALLRRF